MELALMFIAGMVFGMLLLAVFALAAAAGRGEH